MQKPLTGRNETTRQRLTASPYTSDALNVLFVTHDRHDSTRQLDQIPQLADYEPLL